MTRSDRLLSICLFLFASLCAANAAQAANCTGSGALSIRLAPCPVSILQKFGTGSSFKIGATVTGKLPAEIFVEATPTANILNTSQFFLAFTSPTQFEMQIGLLASLGSGIHTGSLDIKLCGDNKCKNVLVDTQLPYTINVLVPPSLSSLSPKSKNVGAAAFTLKVLGGGFTTGSSINFGGTKLAATRVSASELTARVDLSKVTAGKTYKVFVQPSPGFPSNIADFALDNPAPMVTALSPADKVAGAAPFTLKVTGKKFVSTSKIHLGTAALTTTYVSSTQLKAKVDLSSTLGTAVDAVTVVSPTPGGGTSTAASFTVDNPAPVVTFVSPDDAPTPINTQLPLEVDGSGFQPGSVIRWNGTNLSTQYASDTKLTATTPANGLSVVGDVTIDVATPGPGGGTSNPCVIAIGQPQPSWLSPTYAYAGHGDMTLTVEGTNFTPSTVVEWNGTPLTTTLQAGNIIQATIPAADLTTMGGVSVSVVNSGLTGVNNTLAFTVVSQPPVIASLSPGFAITGAVGFTLTVFGDHFASNAMVEWNGTNLNTTFVSASELRAAVPAKDLTAQGLAAITVVNPTAGNGTSTKAMFSIATDGTLVTSMAQTASDVEWAPGWDLLYASVPTGATTNAQSLLQIDPRTLTVVRAQDLSAVPGVTGFNPDQLSLSGEGDLLYVSGSGWLLRFDAHIGPAQFQTGSQTAGATIPAVQPSPALAEVVSWITVKSGIATRHIDSNGGTSSSNTAQAWDVLAWSPDGGTLYSADGTFGADFSSLDYGITTGVQNETVTPGLWSGTRMQVDAASGLIYGDNSPSVIDPAGPSVVGTFPVSGIMVPDSILGCAYFIVQTADQVGTSDWTLACYSTADYTTLIRSELIPSVVGTPTRMKRWGAEGLVFITDGGYIYFVSGQVVTGN